MEAAIPMEKQPILRTTHGLDYLSRIRHKLPESLQLMLVGAEKLSWKEFLFKLQQYQNQVKIDNQRSQNDKNPQPISSFPTVSRYPQLLRRSQRNAQPPIRFGQNVAYPRTRPVCNQQSTFQLHQNSQRRQGSTRFPRPSDISFCT